MECLQNRIDSFSKPVRVQSASKTGTAKNVKWPHPDSFLAQPATLAEAGFYFDPSYDERDNATCFVCGKELAGWEEHDDPFEIHWSKCAKTCAWAVVRCGLRDEMDASGQFKFSDKNRLPSSKAMEKARQQLYSIGNGWIHDKVRNHGASSKRLAKAGFVFTPQHPEDDLATCLYCGVSLSTWDASDDPLEEHRKRSPSCPFFVNTSLVVSTTTKSRASSSKPSSRVSTAPTKGRSRSGMPDIFEDIIEPLAPPVISSTTGGRKASRSTRRTVALVEDENEVAEEPKKSEKSGSTSRSVPRKVSSRTIKRVESVQEEDEGEEEMPLTITTTKSTSSKKGSRFHTANLTSVEEQTGMGGDDLPAARSNSTLPKKSSRLKKSIATSSSIDDYATAPEEVLEEEEEEWEEGEEEEEKLKPPSRKSRKPSRATRLKPKSVQIEDEEDSGQKLGKSTTSKKRSRSKKSTKAVLSEEDDDDGDTPNIEPELPQPAKKSGRSTKAKKVVTSKDAEKDELNYEPPAALNKSTTGKGSRSRKAVSPIVAIPENEENEPPKKSRSGSRKTQAVRSASPVQSEAQDEDNEAERLVIPKKGRKGKMKKGVRKTTAVEADADNHSEEVVVVRAGGKGKRATVKVVDSDVDEEEDELTISKSVKTSIGGAKSTTTNADELIIPKTAKLSSNGKDIRTPIQFFSRKDNTVEATSEEQEQSGTKSNLSVQAKGEPKEDEVSAPEDEAKDVSAALPPSEVKNQLKPVVHEFEQSDSDVEMEDATIVLKMLKRKSTSMGRLRLPSPPTPPASQPEEPDDNESEAEVQANLEEVDLDADMDMALPVVKPVEGERRSLPQVPHEQGSSGLHDDEDDHAISFAPRLVTKLVEEQRSQTPDLAPIRTSNVPVVLGGPQIAFAQEVPKSVVPCERLMTSPRTAVFESITVSSETTTSPSISFHTSSGSKDNSETKADQTSRASPEEKLGTEESESIPQFTPYLSKLPFMALHVLSDAELDMTVEEWIRYQIEVEFDKFKRDGERELGKFRKRAEEVRKIIEEL